MPPAAAWPMAPALFLPLVARPAIPIYGEGSFARSCILSRESIEARLGTRLHSPLTPGIWSAIRFGSRAKLRLRPVY